MNYLMEPTGVAIIGASEDQSTINGKILKFLLKHHYKGRIYPVNPKYKTISDLTCYPSVESIPDQVDLTLIAVAASRVPGVLHECGTKGVKRVIIFSSGFSETGQEGKVLQDEIKKIARTNNIRLIGPNCLGVINVSNGLMASFSASLEIDKVRTGSVALVSQSGAVGFMLFNLLQDNGIGVNSVITTGNEVDLTTGEALAYVVEKPETEVIVTYLEGLRDKESFRKTAERAVELGKPIIALKVGNSASGQKAAATHTAALTGSGASYKSYFEKMCILQVNDSDEVIDYAQAFNMNKLPKGSRVGIVTMSGGVGILLADRCEETGYVVPELSDPLQKEIRKVIPAFGCAQNPIDVTAQSLNLGNEFKQCLKLLLESDELDILIVAITMATGKLARKIGQDIAEAARQTEKPLVVCWSVGDIAKPGFEVLSEAGVPLYHSPTRAVKALGALSRYAALKQGWSLPEPIRIVEERKAKIEAAFAENGQTLGERTTKEILKLYGLPVTQEYLADTADRAVQIAEELGYPVVMKVDSPDIVHKTDAGGVAIGVQSAAEVRTKFQEILTNAKAYNPEAEIKGVLIQEQVPGGVETFIGLQRDPVLGSQVVFGLGGIFVEVLKDVVMKPVPLSKADAQKMLQEIKGAALLNGVRGRRPVDQTALVEILMGVSQLAVEAKDTLLSLDINPVVVFEQGKGAKVLDGVLIGETSGKSQVEKPK